MAIDKFLVEASHIMMFARSVGDDNPIYHDEEYANKTDLEELLLLRLLLNRAPNLIQTTS